VRRVLLVVLASLGCASGLTALAASGCSSGSTTTVHTGPDDAGEDVVVDSTIPVGMDTYVPQEALTPYDGPIDDCDPFTTCLDADVDGAEAVDTDADYARTYVSGSLSVAGSMGIDLGDAGANISSSDIPGIIGAQITDGQLPWDPNGIYFFLASAEVAIDNGALGNEYCGFHQAYPFNPDAGVNGYLHYAVSGDLATYWDNCSGFAYAHPTPSNNLTADILVSIMAHEIAESATDPMVLIDNAWLGDGSEICDECVYLYGTVYELTAGLGKGAPYNVQMGGNPFLVQQVWQMGPWSTSHCTVGANPGFDTTGAMLEPDGGVITVYDWQSPARYWGGPVMTQPIGVYLVFYGEWSNRSLVEPIITGFVNGLGTSPWWSVVSSYFSEVVPVEGGTSD
jgi:phosphate-induced protein 1